MEANNQKSKSILAVATAGEGNDSASEDAVLDLFFFENCAQRAVV